jgi:hypothetical protein
MAYGSATANRPLQHSLWADTIEKEGRFGENSLAILETVEAGANSLWKLRDDF